MVMPTIPRDYESPPWQRVYDLFLIFLKLRFSPGSGMFRFWNDAEKYLLVKPLRRDNRISVLLEEIFFKKEVSNINYGGET